MKEIETKTTKGMSFDEYWSKNKAKLMNTKITTETIARQIWGDCIDINIDVVDKWDDIK